MPTPTAEIEDVPTDISVEFHDDRRDVVTNLDTGEKQYVFYGNIVGLPEETHGANSVWCYVPDTVLRDGFPAPPDLMDATQDERVYEDTHYNDVYLANKEEIQAKARQRILAGETARSSTPHLHYAVRLTRSDFGLSG